MMKRWKLGIGANLGVDIEMSWSTLNSIDIAVGA